VGSILFYYTRPDHGHYNNNNNNKGQQWQPNRTTTSLSIPWL
jgi:hypothetical protein